MLVPLAFMARASAAKIPDISDGLTFPDGKVHLRCNRNETAESRVLVRRIDPGTEGGRAGRFAGVRLGNAGLCASWALGILQAPGPTRIELKPSCS